MAVLENLVNKQFRENFLRIKLSAKKKRKVLPCITVSQENGSCGRPIAPFKTRLKSSKKYEYPKLSEMDIREKLLKVHIGRKEFVRKYFHKDLSNANYYDLVINTEHLSLDQSAKIIISAYKNKFNI